VKDVGRNIVHRKRKRKTPYEMDRRCNRLDSNEVTAVDGEDQRKGAMKTCC
jgi:hypothetical protein